MMKAIVLDEVGGALQLQEMPKPAIGATDVRVKLVAAALNRRDFWIQQGQYPGISLPCILGSDGAGVIDEVGDKVRGFKPGHEVVVNPGWDWGTNALVASRQFTILGMPNNGTFAEYISVPERYIHRKPSHLSFEEAAALPLAGVTAYRALFARAAAKHGEKVLITGIGGGVAMICLQFALAHGMEAWVTSGSQEKIDTAVAMGAKGGALYHQDQWHKMLMKEAGLFDVIIDSAGGKGFGALVDLAAPAGRITFYGGTSGKIDGIVPGKVFFKQLTIMGSTMGNEQDFENMLLMTNAHQIKPHVGRIFPLAETAEAVKYMGDFQHMGKIVLKI